MIEMQKLIKCSFLLHLAASVLGGITVIPQEFMLKYTDQGYPYGNLTVLCKPLAVAGMRGISFMQIRKIRKDSEEDVLLADLSPDLNNGIPVREQGLSGRTVGVRGAIVSEKPEDSYLRLEFVDRSCLDEGSFVCLVNFYRDGARPTERWSDSADVQTTTAPEKVIVHQSPAYDSFLVGQLVQLRCSGQVGSPPAWLRWRWRRVGSDSPNDSEFQPLNFGTLHGEGPYPQGFCKYFRASILYLRANSELDGVEIRCSPVRSETEFTDLSASFTFKVKEGGCIPDCWNGGVCVQNVCECPQNFTGSFCEETIGPPPCYSLKCQEANTGNTGEQLDRAVTSVMLLIALAMTQ